MLRCKWVVYLQNMSVIFDLHQIFWRINIDVSILGTYWAYQGFYQLEVRTATSCFDFTHSCILSRFCLQWLLPLQTWPWLLGNGSSPHIYKASNCPSQQLRHFPPLRMWLSEAAMLSRLDPWLPNLVQASDLQLSFRARTSMFHLSSQDKLSDYFIFCSGNNPDEVSSIRLELRQPPKYGSGTVAGRSAINRYLDQL
jgi:hypothetical protein